MLTNKRTYLVTIDGQPPWAVEASSYAECVEMWQTTVETDDEPDQVNIFTPRSVITEESCTRPAPARMGFTGE